MWTRTVRRGYSGIGKSERRLLSADTSTFHQNWGIAKTCQILLSVNCWEKMKGREEHGSPHMQSPSLRSQEVSWSIKLQDSPLCRTYTGRAACWKHHRETISQVQGVRNSSGRITDFFHKLMAWKLNKRRKGTDRLRDSTDVSTKWYMLDTFLIPV